MSSATAPKEKVIKSKAIEMQLIIQFVSFQYLKFQFRIIKARASVVVVSNHSRKVCDQLMRRKVSA